MIIAAALLAGVVGCYIRESDILKRGSWNGDAVTAPLIPRRGTAMHMNVNVNVVTNGHDLARRLDVDDRRLLVDAQPRYGRRT